jgi:hypothetical protein
VVIVNDSRTQINVRVTQEDAALLARLERAYGLNTAGVTRFAWRYLEEHGPIAMKEREMKTVTVRNEEELKAALTVAGLTPSPLPVLPVEVAGVRYEWSEDVDLDDLDDEPVEVPYHRRFTSPTVSYTNPRTGTRTYVAVEMPDGEVRAVWQEWDGPDFAGYHTKTVDGRDWWVDKADYDEYYRRTH